MPEWSRSQREQDVGSLVASSRAGLLAGAPGCFTPPPPAAPPGSLFPSAAGGEWCLPSLLPLFQLLVSCVVFTSASSNGWQGLTVACWVRSPEGAAVHWCILGGRRGQLKAESLGGLPGEAPSPEPRALCGIVEVLPAPPALPACFGLSMWRLG